MAVVAVKKDIEYIPGISLEVDECNFLSGAHGYTAKIQDAINRVKHEFIYIGFLLCEVDSFGYYREGGFDNVYDYCEVAFGFKRSSTNNFMRVYRQFGDGMGLKEAYQAYSYSHLVEMCSMNGYQLSLCRPEYSVSKLRDIKKQNPPAGGCSSVKSDPVQTSGFSFHTDKGVMICPDHYTALELYLSNRFSNKCDYDSVVDFIEFVKGTGCDFKLCVKSGVHSTIYKVSVVFDVDGAHVSLNGSSAIISPSACYYILRRNVGSDYAEYLV